jgi:hypothetical protein
MKPITLDDARAFLSALEQACPKNCARDRFGRLMGTRNTNPLRDLAIKYRIENGGQDTLDQAAMIARKMLATLGDTTE